MSKAALLQGLEKQRQDRERQRAQEAEAAANRHFHLQAVLRIQSFVRGRSARQQWSEAEWRSLQKQVQDLSTLANVVKLKGQHFVAPCKVLLVLLRRCHWQALRFAGSKQPDELAEVLCTLADFALDGLRARLADMQRSLCQLMTPDAFSSQAAHVPDISFTLLRFCEALLEAATGSLGRGRRTGADSGGSRISTPNAASASCKLSELLDAESWAGGEALIEAPGARQLASKLLTSAVQADRLHSWCSATAGAAAAWPGGVEAPERVQGLAAVAVAWLRLAFQDPHGQMASAAELLEAMLGVPRLGAPIASRFRNLVEKKSETETWSLALVGLARRLKSGPQLARGSAKAHKREYAMAYAAGNLWELYASLQSNHNCLPLGPVLVVQAQLTELAVEVSMLPGTSFGYDEPVALQALRQQLQQLADPTHVTKHFCQILGLRYCPKMSVSAPINLRAYQRHCVAIAQHALSPQAVEALVHTYSTLLLKARAAMRAGSGHLVYQSLANSIAYMEGGDVAKSLWRHIQGFCRDWRSVSREGEAKPLSDNLLHFLHLHAVLLSQSLSIMTQDELRGPGGPLCQHDVSSYACQCTALASRLAWHSAGTAASSNRLAEDVLECLGRVLGQLRGLCSHTLVPGAAHSSLQLPLESWHAPPDILTAFSAAIAELQLALQQPQQGAQHALPAGAERLLRCVPQAVPFSERAALLRAFVQVAREAGLAKPTVKLSVRRSHLFEDGLTTLMMKDAEWRARFHVTFVSPLTGRPEQGQDAGGLFKEFWEKLAETAFNPEYGLFRSTEQRLLYPNPEAYKYHDNVEVLFEFLGLVIGKAIYEGIVVEPCFAPFFLAKILGKHNSYYDLQSLDPALFANLQQLKEYKGDVSDLCCSFVATGADGEEVPLLPGSVGKDVPVTNDNCVKYIYLLSDYKLNAELKMASSAFLSGFRRLIDDRWLRMLDESELQQVISGSQGAAFDVEDLQRHTETSNCSGSRDRLIVDFFTALKAMTPENRMKLLRFVTSCSRAPLLGFVHLQPPFTVHKVHVRSDSEKLPTASTCFNTLKLPTYSSWKVMKQKLEFVIVQEAGFDLD